MTLPNVDMNLLDQPTLEKVQAKELDHPPRILLLYGSLRQRSFSRLVVEESARFACKHPKSKETCVEYCKIVQ